MNYSNSPNIEVIMSHVWKEAAGDGKQSTVVVVDADGEVVAGVEVEVGLGIDGVAAVATRMAGIALSESGEGRITRTTEIFVDFRG